MIRRSVRSICGKQPLSWPGSSLWDRQWSYQEQPVLHNSSLGAAICVSLLCFDSEAGWHEDRWLCFYLLCIPYAPQHIHVSSWRYPSLMGQTSQVECHIPAPLTIKSCGRKQVTCTCTQVLTKHMSSNTRITKGKAWFTSRLWDTSALFFILICFNPLYPMRLFCSWLKSFSKQS